MLSPPTPQVHVIKNPDLEDVNRFELEPLTYEVKTEK